MCKFFAVCAHEFRARERFLQTRVRFDLEYTMTIDPTTTKIPWICSCAYNM